MFHFSSNRKAMESALMGDEKLCRNNTVISSWTNYVSKICQHMTNTRTKISHNQNNTIKLLDPLHSMNIHSQNITQSNMSNYTPNTSTKSIYYCIKTMASNTYLIPQLIGNIILNLCWEWEISSCKYIILN